MAASFAIIALQAVVGFALATAPSRKHGRLIKDQFALIEPRRNARAARSSLAGALLFFGRTSLSETFPALRIGIDRLHGWISRILFINPLISFSDSQRSGIQPCGQRINGESCIPQILHINGRFAYTRHFPF